MSAFLCPICRLPLEKDGRRLLCEHGHSFDLASEGYVHLLPPNKMNSKVPGDSKEMAASRSAFLGKGYYKPLLDALSGCVLGLAEGGEISVLDCGCGEGYYTAGLLEALKNGGVKPKIVGIDISRPSVRRAAKRSREIEFAVASVFDLPLLCSSFDVLVNVFSPLALEEYLRVLKPSGYYVYVVPGPRHLWQLKAAVYDRPYENREEDTPYDGFEHVKAVPVRFEMDMDNKEDVFALFQMTPYYWKTSAAGAKKLEKLDSLKTEAAFDIHIYRKK